jgi:hypothetical protein
MRADACDLPGRTATEAAMSDDEIDVEYQSGPYCRHWGDPVDCEETCVDCGHRCGVHPSDGCSRCDCPRWNDSGDQE